MQNSSHIAIDLSQCHSENTQKSFGQIRTTLEASIIERNPGTENIKIIGENKDARWEHHDHIMFQNKEEETLARIYDQWIKLHFSEGRSLAHNPEKYNPKQNPKN